MELYKYCYCCYYYNISCKTFFPNPSITSSPQRKKSDFLMRYTKRLQTLSFLTLSILFTDFFDSSSNYLQTQRNFALKNTLTVFVNSIIANTKHCTQTTYLISIYPSITSFYVFDYFFNFLSTLKCFYYGKFEHTQKQ